MTSLKENLTTYSRPANCEKLAVTQVNPQIWGKRNRLARLNGVRLSRIQEQVAKVGLILVRNTEHLLKTKSSPQFCLEDLFRMKTDAFTLLGHACAEITQRGRESIKSSLHKDYAMLYSNTVPVT